MTNTLKIAIVGYGKMGQSIAEIAKSKGHKLVIIDPAHEAADFPTVSAESLAGVDVGIEFTAPTVVIKNIELFCEHKVNLVVGTTGWYDQIPEIKKLAVNNAVLYGSNFSVGVNVFFKIVEQAAKIVNHFPDFDISGIDIHHNQKVDSPSGTAITTAQLLIDNVERKSKACYDKLDRKPEDNEIHFASLRAGSVPGSHEVILDSPAEAISIKVAARNRSGYASGAVLAAEWLTDKKGFYKFEDLLTDIV